MKPRLLANENFPALSVQLEIYNGTSAASVSFQHAIQRSLLKSLSRTNTLLTRLISHDRLARAGDKAQELEAALHGQIWRAEGQA